MDKRKVLEDNFVFQRGNPGAVVNRDIDGLLAYKEARRKRLLEETNKPDINEINSIKEEVSSLKNDISQIKSLLEKVLENKWP